MDLRSSLQHHLELLHDVVRAPFYHATRRDEAHLPDYDPLNPA
jgi:hypothetical protein